MLDSLEKLPKDICALEESTGLNVEVPDAVDSWVPDGVDGVPSVEEDAGTA